MNIKSGVVIGMVLTDEAVKAIDTVRGSIASIEQIFARTCNLRQEPTCSRSIIGQSCSECLARSDKALLEQEEEVVAFKTCHKRPRLMMGHKIADDCCRIGVPVNNQRRNCEYCPALADFLDLLGEHEQNLLNFSARKDLSC